MNTEDILKGLSNGQVNFVDVASLNTELSGEYIPQFAIKIEGKIYGFKSEFCDGFSLTVWSICLESEYLELCKKFLQFKDFGIGGC